LEKLSESSGLPDVDLELQISRKMLAEI